MPSVPPLFSKTTGLTSISRRCVSSTDQTQGRADKLAASPGGIMGKKKKAKKKSRGMNLMTKAWLESVKTFFFSCSAAKQQHQQH